MKIVLIDTGIAQNYAKPNIISPVIATNKQLTLANYSICSA